MVSHSYRMINLGAGMATPSISGFGVLHLELNPNLDPEDIKVLFKTNSCIPGMEPRSIGPKWAFALINALGL